MHHNKGRKLITVQSDFWSAVNVDYVTDMIREYCKVNFDNCPVMSAHVFNCSQRRIYHIIHGRKKANTLTWDEFKRILGILGYKVQFRIVSK